jgi:hypothetical protein
LPSIPDADPRPVAMLQGQIAGFANADEVDLRDVDFAHDVRPSVAAGKLDGDFEYKYK